MSPPGLGLASISDKAWAAIQGDDRGPRSYFDYRRFKPNADKGEPTYTAPVTMLTALQEALAMIAEEGLDATPARHNSEERRVGNEGVRTCRSRWLPHHNKKNKT